MTIQYHLCYVDIVIEIQFAQAHTSYYTWPTVWSHHSTEVLHLRRLLDKPVPDPLSRQEVNLNILNPTGRIASIATTALIVVVTVELVTDLLTQSTIRQLWRDNDISQWTRFAIST